MTCWLVSVPTTTTTWNPATGGYDIVAGWTQEQRCAMKSIGISTAPSLSISASASNVATTPQAQGASTVAPPPRTVALMLVGNLPGTRGLVVVKGSLADGRDYVMIDDTKLAIDDVKLALAKVQVISALPIGATPTLYMPISGVADPSTGRERAMFEAALHLLRKAPKTVTAYGLHPTLVIGLGSIPAMP